MGRTRLHVNTGNLLEVCGGGLACYAVSGLWGVGWALLVGAVLLVVAAELVYDAHSVAVPLPKRPRPVRRAVGTVGDVRKTLRAHRALRGAQRALREGFGEPSRVDRIRARIHR